MCAKVTSLTPAEVFAKRVKEVRQLRAFTQAELARKLSIDRTTLNKIEAGTRGDVSISQLFAFAEALDIAPVYLISPHRNAERVELTVGGRVISGREARAWVRGQGPPMTGSGKDLAEWLLTLPQDELLEWLVNHDPNVAAVAKDPLIGMLVFDKQAVVERVMKLVQDLERERKRRTKGGKDA
jgi:transcriptional regulator with XRE-family HTH domain